MEKLNDCEEKELRLCKTMCGESDISANMWAMRKLVSNGLVRHSRMNDGTGWYYITRAGVDYLNNRKHAVRITYSNNDTIETEINGTEEEVKKYYAIGNEFNIGSVEDNIQKVVKLEFIR
jgi:hypothetical protein